MQTVLGKEFTKRSAVHVILDVCVGPVLQQHLDSLVSQVRGRDVQRRAVVKLRTTTVYVCNTHYD